MNKLLIILFFSLAFFACSNTNDFDHALQMNADLSQFVDSLNATSLRFKKCETCTLNGLEENQLIGFTDRYPPNGYYDKTEIELGEFEYDSYLILNTKNDEATNGYLHICYFNKQQQELFFNFSPYYANQIAHQKLHYRMIKVKNTVLIFTEIIG